MTRLAVVSSRIFDCPCSLYDIVGGILRPSRMRRTSLRGLVERVSGRDVGDQADGELPIRALQRRRPEAALDGGDVVDAHLAGGRRHGQPSDLRDVAPLVLEHADLDRVLLGTFLVERDLVVAGHREPERVADGRHPHAEIGRALAIDGDVNLRIRDVQGDLDVGEARQLLRRQQRALRVIGDLAAGRARGCSRRWRSRRCLRRCRARCAP